MLDPAILLGLLGLLGLIVAAAAFAIGASLECDCEKRARREREARKQALDTLADREVAKLEKRGWR